MMCVATSNVLLILGIDVLPCVCEAWLPLCTAHECMHCSPLLIQWLIEPVCVGSHIAEHCATCSVLYSAVWGRRGGCVLQWTLYLTPSALWWWWGSTYARRCACIRVWVQVVHTCVHTSEWSVEYCTYQPSLGGWCTGW